VNGAKKDCWAPKTSRIYRRQQPSLQHHLLNRLKPPITEPRKTLFFFIDGLYSVFSVFFGFNILGKIYKWFGGIRGDNMNDCGDLKYENFKK
jgi:hypothetical protein